MRGKSSPRRGPNGRTLKKTPDTFRDAFLTARDVELQGLVDRFLSGEQDAPTVLNVEGLVRAALYQTGARVVAVMFQAVADRVDAAYRPRAGEHLKQRESIQIQCLFGSFVLERNYYWSATQGGHCPADEALGLEAGHSPSLVRLACLEGADETSFEKAQRHLEETGGIAMDSRQIQRLVQRVGPTLQAWPEREEEPPDATPAPIPILYVSADGTGIPMRKEELLGRKGKQPDGKSKTRQVYLGCVFTQHKTDGLGRPVRDGESTTYVASMQNVDAFGPLLRNEAIRRGMGNAVRQVFIVDGASGLEAMGRINFKDAIQIVDFYHAMEHAGLVLAALPGGKAHPDYKHRLRKWAKRLLRNGVANLVADARKECAGQPCAPAVEEQLHYFESNVERMQYGTFRKNGFFIGSGVVEAGCKTVVGQRCKQSGMFWSQSGAEHVLALRAIHASRQINGFWKFRLEQCLAPSNPTQTPA